MIDALHTVPLADMTAHDISTDQPDCICGPRVEDTPRVDGSTGRQLIHHSLDGREQQER